METKIDLLIFFIILIAIYLKLNSLLNNIRHLTLEVELIKKHLAGDPDASDSTMIKPSIKELIVNRCLGIEHELIRFKHDMSKSRKLNPNDNSISGD